MSDLEAIWADDLLGDRKGHADFLERFLVSKGQLTAPEASSPNAGSFVLNIDAPWGAGKTFFLDRFEKQLALNHIVIRVDAWRYDYVDDPLIPVIDAFKTRLSEPSINSDLKPKIQTFLKQGSALAGAIAMGALKQAGRRYLGDAMDQIDEQLSGDAGELVEEAVKGGVDSLFKNLTIAGKVETESFEKTREVVDSFVDALSNLAKAIDEDEGKRGPIIILIDELDRCRPTYAIQMLERVKHLFGVPGVVFVLATNTEQLKHSIKSVYGSGFDAHIYLQRFFSRTYTFEKTEALPLIESKLNELNLPSEQLVTPFGVSHVKIIADFTNAFGSEVREIETLLQMLGDAVAAKQFKSPIIVPYFLFIALATERGLVGLLELLPGKAGRQVERSLTEVLSHSNIVLPEYEHPRRPGRISMNKLIARIIQLSNAPENEILKVAEQVSQQGDEGHWATQYFYEESNHEQSGMKASRFQPTVLSYYDDLVRSAGRLSTSAPKKALLR